MKTEKELNDAILKITMTINEKFPELSKYMEEMPITIPNTENPVMGNKTLTDYYDSLVALLEKYEGNHEG